MQTFPDPTTPRERANLLAERSMRITPKRGGAVDYPQLSATQPHDIELWVAAVVSQSLASKKAPFDPAQIAAIARVARDCIGTHGFKSPEALVDTEPVTMELPANDYSIEAHLLGERNVAVRKRLIFSGNAADLSIAKFLLATCILDGQATTVLESLVARDAVCAALCASGMPAEVADRVREARAEHAARDLAHLPIHPLSKQVFFEAEGEQDVLILPNGGDALLGELHARSRANPAQWQKNRLTIRIGGVQPQNAGMLYAELRGHVPLLLASPPPPPTPIQTLLYRIRQGRSVFSPHLVTPDELQRFMDAVPETPQESRLSEREREARAYRRLAASMVAVLDELDALTEAALLDPRDSQLPLPPALRHYLLRHTPDSAWDNRYRSDLAAQILSDVLARHPYAAWRKREHAANVTRNLKEAIEEALQ